MKLEELKKLFPVTVDVTEEMIKQGSENVYNTSKCIGALALVSVLRPDLVKYDDDMSRRHSWGTRSGTICETSVFQEGDEFFNVESTLNGRSINMMNVTSPITIVLSVM